MKYFGQMLFITVWMMTFLSLTNCEMAQRNRGHFQKSWTHNYPLPAYFINVPQKEQKCPKNQQRNIHGICRPVI